MGTKVSNVGSLIKIETPTNTKYYNKQSVSVEFQGGKVLIGSEFLEDMVPIILADFQDGAGTPITTEEAIVIYIDGLLS